MGRSRALGETVHVDPVVDDDRVGGGPACRDQPGLERAPRRLADRGHVLRPQPALREAARPTPAAPQHRVVDRSNDRNAPNPARSQAGERPRELGDLRMEVNEVGADALDGLAES